MDVHRKCPKCGVQMDETTACDYTLRTRRGYCRACNKKYNGVHAPAMRVADPKSAILYRLRGNAKVRGISFSLEREDIPDIPEFCPVFPWIRLEYKVGEGRSEGSASVDRIDSAVGYVKGNIRFISHRANTLKSDATDEQLIALGKDAESRTRPSPGPFHPAPVSPRRLDLRL